MPRPVLTQWLLYPRDQRLGFCRLPHSPSKKVIAAEKFGAMCVKPTNTQNQSQTGREILCPDLPFLSNSIRPSSQDQKDTQKTEAACHSVRKDWFWRPFLPPAAADPGEKPSDLTFRGPPPALVLASSPCSGAVLVRALFPHLVTAGKFKVFWQQEAPLLHPLHCTLAFWSYRGFAEPELPATATWSVRPLRWELDTRHEALLPWAPASLRRALLHLHALVFLLSRYFSSPMLQFVYSAFSPHSSQYF